MHTLFMLLPHMAAALTSAINDVALKIGKRLKVAHDFNYAITAFIKYGLISMA